ncbi:glycosyl hydrolase [Epilithonimonas vandammei]|uniref:glycosyl hydrolase n=1 Tax=Epilithonimonas vandammei TaxID=2487072 RepID=UPI00289C010D|nr:glycosyl hydrolase [Epilithonimonas vandammei]
MKIFKIIFFLIILISCTDVKKNVPNNYPNIILGVNGHPLTSNDYKLMTLDNQIKLIKDYKASYYRIDIVTDQNGRITLGKELFDSLIKLTKTNKIEILPNVALTGLDYSTSDSLLYKKGFSVGEGFTKTYDEYFKVIEIGNENDLKIALRNKDEYVFVNGKLQFDPAKKNKLLNYIKGFYDGIKSINNRKQTIIGVSADLSGSNMSFYDELFRFNINIDILGTNWYDDKKDSFQTYIELLSKLKKKYKKQIWVTELNYKEGSTNVSADVQKVWLNNMVDNLSKSKLVDAIFIYQLFDEDSNLNKPGVPAFEANFGIYKIKNNKIEKKL